jgi:hypothetical protein
LILYRPDGKTVVSVAIIFDLTGMGCVDVGGALKIRYLATAENERLQGHARDLVDVANTLAQAMEKKLLLTYVEQTNTAAALFWKKMGFSSPSMGGYPEFGVKQCQIQSGLDGWGGKANGTIGLSKLVGTTRRDGSKGGGVNGAETREIGAVRSRARTVEAEQRTEEAGCIDLSNDIDDIAIAAAGTVTAAAGTVTAAAGTVTAAVIIADIAIGAAWVIASGGTP